MTSGFEAMHAQDQFGGSCPGRAPAPLNRRDLLKASATGFGWLALQGLMQQRSFGASAVAPHFAAPAKNVIFLFMDGGVSHVDSFDPKPALTKHEGEPWTGDAARKWGLRVSAFRSKGMAAESMPSIPGRTTRMPP